MYVDDILLARLRDPEMPAVQYCEVCERQLTGQRQITEGRCPSHRDDAKVLRGVRWSRTGTIVAETPANRTFTGVTVGEFLEHCRSLTTVHDPAEYSHLPPVLLDRWAEKECQELARCRALVRYVPMANRVAPPPLPKQTSELKSAVNFAASMTSEGKPYVTATQIAARYYKVDVDDVRRLMSSRSGKSRQGKRGSER